MTFSSKIVALIISVSLFANVSVQASAAAEITRPFKIAAGALLGAGTGYVFSDVVKTYGKEASFGAAAIIATAFGGLYYLRSDVVIKHLGAEFLPVSTLAALMTFLVRYTQDQKNEEENNFRKKEVSSW